MLSTLSTTAKNSFMASVYLWWISLTIASRLRLPAPPISAAPASRRKCRVVSTSSSTSLHLVTGRKERFYLTTHSTHFIYGYMASDMVKDHSDSERQREMFYLTMHSTHFIYGYMASDMVKDHSDSEKEREKCFI